MLLSKILGQSINIKCRYEYHNEELYVSIIMKIIFCACRAVLLACLGVCAAVTSLMGTSVVWMLSNRKPQFLKSKQSARGSDTYYEQKTATKPQREHIPVGIAWEELRREKDIENAQPGSLSEPGVSRGETLETDKISKDAQVI